MRFVSLDIETTSLNPTEGVILELAVVVADTYDGIALQNSWLIKPDEDVKGSRIALKMNENLITEALATGLPQEQVSREFNEFIEKHVPGPVIVAGKNVAGFDLPWLKHHGFTIPRLAHRTLDPTICYMKHTDTKPPSLSECLTRAGLSNTVSHRALDDARQVAQLVIRSMINVN